MSKKQFDPQNNAADLTTAWKHGMDDGSGDSQGTVSAEEAGYLAPDQGPFECQNCLYFTADGQPCQKVSEPVSAQGVCTLFQTKGAESQAQEHSEGGAGAAADIVPQQTASI